VSAHAQPLRSEGGTLYFVTKYFYPVIGGMEKQALTVAAALVKKGWRVQVITSRVNRSWPAYEEIDNVAIVRLPSLRLKYAGAAVFLISLVVYLYKKRSSFDIIHLFQVGYTSCTSILAAKLFKKASVLKLACSGPGGDIQSNRRSLLGRLFLAGCKQADAAIALNTEVRQELISIGYPAENVFDIPNGVDDSVYCPVESRESLKRSLGMPDEKIVLYTGRILFVQKRLDWLVNALSKIKDPPGFTLYIIGEGPDADVLKCLCGQLCVNAKVHILGNVDTIAPFLQAADVFVLPSEYEGVSNSVLEAMASGLAVIATDIPGNRELLDDGVTGLLIPCGDEERLISAVHSLTGDGERAALLGRQARAKVCQKYSLGIIVRKYSDLYARLLIAQASQIL
jgi:glycosyltransferase involved in cell wall biosynthesis